MVQWLSYSIYDPKVPGSTRNTNLAPSIHRKCNQAVRHMTQPTKPSHTNDSTYKPLHQNDATTHTKILKIETTSGCFYPRSNHWEVGGRPQGDKCGCRVRNCSQHRLRQFQTTGTAIRRFSSGRPRGTTPTDDRYIVLARRNRPEETGGRQREKSLDTRHRRLDDRYRVLPWPEDCTVVVCLHDAQYDESRFSLSSDSHRILIWRERGSRNHPSNIIERDRGAMGLQFLFMDDNAPCHRTVAAEQLLESEDIERMDWPARSPDLNPIEHVWDFLGRRLAARTLPPVTIRELRLALQDEWAAMPQQLIDTLILSMGRRCETCLAVRGDHIPY
ncbi:transposable element Tcb1 transposase [Trichonephila clavipes]|nr:transposable element Tcb1 transposase [Trichonephila clavipes]